MGPLHGSVDTNGMETVLALRGGAVEDRGEDHFRCVLQTLHKILILGTSVGIELVKSRTMEGLRHVPWIVFGGGLCWG